jgi:hypothetical protein
MKARRLFLFLLAAGTLGATPQAPNTRTLTDRGKLLDAEVLLAKTNKSYLYIDREAGRIELRIQGLVLKSWNMVSFKSWGRPLPSGVFKLIRKEALRTPKRKNITPNTESGKETKTADQGLEVLEVKDMPASFRFDCSAGITLHFRARPVGLLKRVGTLFGKLGRSLWLPLRTISAAARGADFTDIQIVLPGELDAKSLYWTVEDGSSVLVLNK